MTQAYGRHLVLTRQMRLQRKVSLRIREIMSAEQAACSGPPDLRLR